MVDWLKKEAVAVLLASSNWHYSVSVIVYNQCQHRHASSPRSSGVPRLTDPARKEERGSGWDSGGVGSRTQCEAYGLVASRVPVLTLNMMCLMLLQHNVKPRNLPLFHPTYPTQIWYWMTTESLITMTHFFLQIHICEHSSVIVKIVKAGQLQFGDSMCMKRRANIDRKMRHKPNFQC